MSSRAVSMPFSSERSTRILAVSLGIVSVAAVLLAIYSLWTVVVLAGIAIFVLSAMENETVLFGSVFLLPFAWILRIDFPISNIVVPARDLVVFGFFAGRIWRGELRVRDFFEHRLSRMSFLFFAAALASVAFGSAGWTHGSVRGLSLLASYIAFYFLILTWVNTPERMRKVVRALFWSTIAVGVFGVFQEFVDGYTSFWLRLYLPDQAFEPWSGRVTSFLGQPNALGGYLNLVLPFSLGCYFLREERLKKLAGFTLAFGATALALSQSRGALLGFTCVIMLGVFYFVERWTRQFAVIGVITLGGTACYLLARMLSPLHFGSINQEPLERLAFWATAWRLFLQSPIFGIGMGNFPEVYGDYIPHSLIPPRMFDVHNLYLQLLSETGLLGTVIFLALVFYAVRLAHRQAKASRERLDKALAFGVIGGLAAILVHGFVDIAPDVSPQLSTLLWFMLALFASCSRFRVPLSVNPQAG